MLRSLEPEPISQVTAYMEPGIEAARKRPWLNSIRLHVAVAGEK